MDGGDVALIFRAEAGRALAVLIRLLGDFDLAEDCLQEAFETAVQRWPKSGRPDNPRAWLTATARNRALDQLRRRARFQARRRMLAAEADIAALAAAGPPYEEEPAYDDVLRLIFTCCHPALGMEARVALTLKTVCGLTTGQIAHGFLVAEETMAQRLVRAKAKIKAAGIPYAVPPVDVLDERLDGVLAVLYLVFTEGYAATPADPDLRRELTGEAIRLARLLDELLPGRAAVKGLLGLMLLQDSRRAARRNAEGDIILLEDQDRGLWDRGQIADGLACVDAALALPGRPASYAVQAAIAALHARAAGHDRTDWPQIVGLYEVLLRIHPSPVIELNHAVALSMVDGPERALARVDALAARGGLDGYHLLPAVRADLLRRLDRREDAIGAYREALALASLEPERRLLRRRLDEMTERRGR